MVMRRRFMSASGIPDNQIWYTTNDGNIIEPVLKPSSGAITADYGFGSALTSNQYYDKGIIKTYGVITQIGRSAFNGASSLISIILPKHVSILEQQAFVGCTSLKDIKLPNALKNISWHCFDECSSLEELTIGEAMTEIGLSAFRGCTSLKTLYVKATTPPKCEPIKIGNVLKYPFNDAPISTIYVPFESVSIYQSESPWKDYTIEGYDF